MQGIERIESVSFSSAMQKKPSVNDQSDGGGGSLILHKMLRGIIKEQGIQNPNNFVDVIYG